MAKIASTAWVFGSAQVYDSACVYGSARVFGSAQVYDSACVYGSARIALRARISCTRDWMSIGPIGSRDDMLTAWRDVDGIGVSTGGFVGLLDGFEAAVRAKHGDDHEYHAAIAMIRRRAATWAPITDDERKEAARA